MQRAEVIMQHGCMPYLNPKVGRNFATLRALLVGTLSLEIMRHVLGCGLQFEQVVESIGVAFLGRVREVQVEQQLLFARRHRFVSALLANAHFVLQTIHDRVMCDI